MRRLTTLATGTVAGSLALLVLAGPALAHVTVSAPGATRGGSDQAITFRVPVEKKVATTALTVVLPVDTPITSVDVAPLAGWTHTEKSVTLPKPIKTDDGDITTAVSQVTWTAQPGHALQPGEYGSFTLLAGQLPDSGNIVFRALQTYADGSIVKWIQVPAPGSKAEPDFPAPTLTLAKGASGTDTAATAPTTVKQASNTGPVVLSIVALVLAAAALGLAVVSRARSRAAG